jgi:hypothetical protein
VGLGGGALDVRVCHSADARPGAAVRGAVGPPPAGTLDAGRPLSGAALLADPTVRGRPGSSAFRVSRSKSVLYGASVWACRALNGPKRRFRARAGIHDNAIKRWVGWLMRWVGWVGRG